MTYDLECLNNCHACFCRDNKVFRALSVCFHKFHEPICSVSLVFTTKPRVSYVLWVSFMSMLYTLHGVPPHHQDRSLSDLHVAPTSKVRTATILVLRSVTVSWHCTAFEQIVTELCRLKCWSLQVRTGSDVLTAMLMKASVFRDMTPCIFGI
jgi:hypothetical protein